MLIKYYTQNVYGVPRRYILDDKIQELYFTLTHFATVSPSHMGALSAFGITWEEVLAPEVPPHKAR